MRVLDRSSTHGDRYERIKARDNRANPGIPGGTADVAFTVPAEEAKRRRFVVAVLKRFRYFRLNKGQRGVLFAYMQRFTGYSRQHLSRLIAQYRATKSLRPASGSTGPALPASTAPPMWRCWPRLDALHDTLRARPPRCCAAGLCPLSAIRAMLGWPKSRFRTSTTCAPAPAIASNACLAKDQASPITIGIRKAPAPQGLPAISASIPCTRAIWTASRASTISTPSTSSPNGNWWPRSSGSAKPFYCP